MKATGVVRRIDDLGRVVIPKEIRRTMRIRNGEPLEIYVDREGEVILKKYAPISELGNYAQEYADSLNEALGHAVCIADRDEIIAVSGIAKKDLLRKGLSSELEEVIASKKSILIDHDHGLDNDGRISVKNSAASPIVVNGEAIGAVIITSKEKTNLGDLERKLADTAASFLAKQMGEKS